MNAAAEVQLEEVKRISNNIFALIDSERTSSHGPPDKKKQEFLEACQKAEVACHMLERRATENYLTDRAIKKVMGNNYQALGPYEQLSKLTRPWSKSDNDRIAYEMTLEELDDTDLGKFLASLQDD